MSLLSTGCSQLHRIGGILIVGLLLMDAPARAAADEYYKLEIGGRPYRIELATTSSQRRQGLMYRRQLERHAGMLLVYDRPGDHRIWMKNVLIPLRVYWIDKDFRVVGMRRLEPCVDNPCPVYEVEQASTYVLELGDYDHDLRTGDRLEGLKDL